jgi:Xaa-Pro dipeptidase
VRVAGQASFAASTGGSSARAVPDGDPARTLLLAGDWPGDPVAALVQLVKENGLAQSRLGIEVGSLLARERERLSAALPAAMLLGCDLLFRVIRAVKTDGEIQLLARATQIGEDAATRAAESADERTTPAQLVDRFRAISAEDGADLDHLALSLDGLGFVTGGDRALGGETAMFYDYGCVYRGWISDAGTTFCVGEPEAAALAEHAAVRGAVATGAEALRPGVCGSSVQRTMQESLAEAGIGESFPHGHGVGLEVREYPILLSADGRTLKDDCVELSADLPLERNMVVNLEASLLTLGERSVHCERTFVVTSDGCRSLAEQYRDAPLVARVRGAQEVRVT